MTASEQQFQDDNMRYDREQSRQLTEKNCDLIAQADTPMTTGQVLRKKLNERSITDVLSDAFLEECAQAAIAADPVGKKLIEAFEAIFGLSEGWDSDGSTGPKNPLSWETVALMSLDIAHAALAEAEQISKEEK